MAKLEWYDFFQKKTNKFNNFFKNKLKNSICYTCLKAG